MKKTLLALVSMLLTVSNVFAQGWPADYDGVMLQGFSWDDYKNTKWTVLENQADELSQYFSLVWIPQSGNCGGKSMGYNPLYYFNQNSSFGKEDQLRSMIATFKAHGMGTIADVVINHRQTLSNWVDFPAEVYKGETYQMTSTDICADDDGGKAKAWADQNGYQLSPNKDSGEGWDGFRDLDHASANVQRCINAYEDFLLNDLGYAGFRYDVGKGFDAKYFGMYNAKAKPGFSVGEVWDNTNTIKNWIDGTKVDGIIQSGAFDFQFRYSVRDAVNNTSWSQIAKDGLILAPEYRRYAITFIENHDTQDRTATGGDYQDPLVKNVEAANAIMMAMPGTPCVFLPHWLEYKNDIKQQIFARKIAGITNTSQYEVVKSSKPNIFVVKCGGLMAQIGDSDLSLADGYQLIQAGNSYFLFLKKECETPWISIPSSEYEAGGKVTQVKPYIYAVTEAADAKLVYTTDGSNPTASSSQVNNGARVTIKPSQTTDTESIILKVGLLVNGEVRDIITRTYTWKAKEPFDPYKITVNVRSEVSALSPLYAYVWSNVDGDQPHGGWPGMQITKTFEQGGYTWYSMTFDIKSEDYMLGFVFTSENPEVSGQTVDVADVNKDSWLVIESTKEGNKYKVTDVTSQYTSLETILANPLIESINDLQGRKVKSPRVGNFYIINGHKVIIK